MKELWITSLFFIAKHLLSLFDISFAFHSPPISPLQQLQLQQNNYNILLRISQNTDEAFLGGITSFLPQDGPGCDGYRWPRKLVVSCLCMQHHWCLPHPPHTRILKLHIMSPRTRQHSPFSHSPMSTLSRSRCYKSIFVTYEIKPCIQVGHLAIPP